MIAMIFMLIKIVTQVVTIFVLVEIYTLSIESCNVLVVMLLITVTIF